VPLIRTVFIVPPPRGPPGQNDARTERTSLALGDLAQW